MSKKPRLLVLLSALACCGASCPAAAAEPIVLANRARIPVKFELQRPSADNQEITLESGAARSFPWLKSMAVEFAARNGARRFRLEAGAIYFFHDFGTGGELELDRISLHETLEPFIADDRKASLPEPSPEPAATEQCVLKLSVKFLVDEEERAARSKWEARLRERVAAASLIFERSCNVRFEVVAVGTWQSDDRITDFEASLGEFEKKVDPRPAELAIGFTSQYQLPAGRTHLGGIRGALRPHILLREWSQHVSETERLELLVHELGHHLGAAHSPESSSVMRPRLADRQALARSFRIDFDPLNVLAMSLVAEVKRLRRDRDFSSLSAPTRRRLRDVYGTLQAALPEDPAAASFLAQIGDPEPVRAMLRPPAGERDEFEDLRDKPHSDHFAPQGEAGRLASRASPLVAATHEVLAAIAQEARRLDAAADPRRLAAGGDELLAAYVHVAASAAVQQPAEERAKAFLFALAIGLDRSDSLRKYAVMGDFVKSVESEEERAGRLDSLGSPTLRRRQDLMQHFLLSAAIQASAGTKSAEAVGLAKELHDASYGSGFSFADWCADLSGIAFARRVQSGDVSLQDLAKRFQIDRVLPELSGLPEGLSAREFKSQYGSVWDTRFKKLDAEIRRRVESLATPPAEKSR
ncbi:MAG TPA: M12 family metallo-peptidase [Pirellulales bacterium]|nr:M12 family metallo-peptidase [Pirellulales bacterium]